MFTTVTSNGKKSSVLLEWITVSTGSDGFFSIEKSKDGKNFRPLGKIRKEGKPGMEAFYLFVDESPTLNGHYRLKDPESGIHSNTVEVSMEQKNRSSRKEKKAERVSA